MAMSLDLRLSVQKLKAVIAQITKLQAEDFPYDEPKDALAVLKTLYEDELTRLTGLDENSDPGIVRQACANVNVKLARFYPRLGFIIRSTDVRNAFEAYDPLLRICKIVYGPDARLILSSEWSFSPFTYPAILKEMPHLMFIGAPASESDNALIMPLTGHELGHSIWRRPASVAQSISTPLIAGLQVALTHQYTSNWTGFTKLINQAHAPDQLLQNLFLRAHWFKSYELALRQTEELFCDCIGLRIFGESYLYSFMYLLAPNLGDRAWHYPTLKSRIEALIRAANCFQIDVPAGYVSRFVEKSQRQADIESFMQQMADAASSSMIDNIIEAVRSYMAASGLNMSSNAERDRIVDSFSLLAPADKTRCVADTINAGWKMYLDAERWKEFNMNLDERHSVLNDLVFKNIEVFEFESRTEGAC